MSDGAPRWRARPREAFAAIPGLAGRGRVNPFVMVLSDNDTKLSGRIDHDAFSMEPTFRSLATLGWSVHEIKTDTTSPPCTTVWSCHCRGEEQSVHAGMCLAAHDQGYGIKATEGELHGGTRIPAGERREDRGLGP